MDEEVGFNYSPEYGDIWCTMKGDIQVSKQS